MLSVYKHPETLFKQMYQLCESKVHWLVKYTCWFAVSGKIQHRVCPSWGSTHWCTKYSYNFSFYLFGVHVRAFSKVLSYRKKKIYFSSRRVLFKITPAVSQQSALRWNKHYTLLNHIPLITTNLLGCFNSSFFKAKNLPEWLHLSTVHITQSSALSVPLILDSPPVMPVKSLRLSG